MDYDHFLETCPGLAGDVARYIDSRLETRQPAVSLAAAFSFVAVLRSKRVVSDFGIEPPLYTLVVGPSGICKTQSQNIIHEIIGACEISSILMGEPASEAGLRQALSNDGRKFLPWDEFGHSLSEMAKSRDSYRVMILSTLMKLYSSAGKPSTGKEYGKEKRVDLPDSYLSVFAASTLIRFEKAMTEELITDGFLPRWMVFFPDGNLRPQKEKLSLAQKKIPANIIHDILEIENAPLQNTGGNLSRNIKIEKRVVPFLGYNDVMLWRAATRFEANQAINEIRRCVWMRAFEQTIKLSLVLGGGLTDFYYAQNFVKENILALIDKCEKLVFRDEKDRREQKFFNLLQLGESVSSRELTRRAQRCGLTKMERKMLIEDYVESGLWILHESRIDTSKKATTFYERPKSQQGESSKIKYLT